MIDMKKKIGLRIRSFRERRGLTQDELGAIADMHRAYVGHGERGEKAMGLRHLGKIARGLGGEVEEMF